MKLSFAMISLVLASAILTSGAALAPFVFDVTDGPVTAPDSFKITIERAREIALGRIPGTIEDEYTLEDEDGNITSYFFIIRKESGSAVEVQIGAEKGDIISVEEESSESPAAEEPPVVEEEPPAVDDTPAMDAEAYDSFETVDEPASYEEPVVDPDPQTAPEASSTQEQPAEDPDAELITFDTARNIALRNASGEVESEEMIYDDDAVYYAFLIRAANNVVYEVRVESVTGRVTKTVKP